MDKGTWRATVHGVSKNRTRLKCLSAHACSHLDHHIGTERWFLDRVIQRAHSFFTSHDSSVLRNANGFFNLKVLAFMSRSTYWSNWFTIALTIKCWKIYSVWTWFCIFKIHEILQARILEWIAVPFSRGSSWPSNRTRVSSIAGRFFTVWASRDGA